MKLVYAPRALAEIERAYLDKLLETPHLGELWGERSGHEIRKVLLPRTKKKLFVRPEPGVVRILCLWGGERGRDPKL